MQRFVIRITGAFSVALLAACGGGAPDAAPAEEPAMAEESAMADEGAMAMELPEGVTQEMIAEGKAIFEGPGLCLTCHGVDATGTTLAPNLTDDEWLNISGRVYEEIVQNIMTGVPQPKQFPSPMPARGASSITDEQVRAVGAYVYSLGSH
jgi:mono/diheme cytochrome c family protein